MLVVQRIIVLCWLLLAYCLSAAAAASAAALALRSSTTRAKVWATMSGNTIVASAKTLIDCAPAVILPQETASSGL